MAQSENFSITHEGTKICCEGKVVFDIFANKEFIRTFKVWRAISEVQHQLIKAEEESVNIRIDWADSGRFEDMSDQLYDYLKFTLAKETFSPKGTMCPLTAEAMLHQMCHVNKDFQKALSQYK